MCRSTRFCSRANDSDLAKRFENVFHHEISSAHKTKILKYKLFLALKLSDVGILIYIFEHDTIHAQLSYMKRARYEVYIVFAFSVTMFVCLFVNFFLCQRFLSNYLT